MLEEQEERRGATYFELKLWFNSDDVGGKGEGGVGRKGCAGVLDGRGWRWDSAHIML